MASRDASRRQLKDLKNELAALSAARQREPRDIAAVLLKRLRACQSERAACEALPIEAKIAAKQKELAELPAHAPRAVYQGRFIELDPMAEYRARELEIDIIELQGGAPAVV